MRTAWERTWKSLEHLKSLRNFECWAASDEVWGEQVMSSTQFNPCVVYLYKPIKSYESIGPSVVSATHALSQVGAWPGPPGDAGSAGSGARRDHRSNPKTHTPKTISPSAGHETPQTDRCMHRSGAQCISFVFLSETWEPVTIGLNPSVGMQCKVTMDRVKLQIAP